MPPPPLAPAPTKGKTRKLKPPPFSMSEVFARPRELFEATRSVLPADQLQQQQQQQQLPPPSWIRPSYDIQPTPDERCCKLADHIKIFRTSTGQRIAVKSMDYYACASTAACAVKCDVGGAGGGGSPLSRSNSSNAGLANIAAAAGRDNKPPLRELEVAKLNICHPNIIRYFACAPPAADSSGNNGTCSAGSCTMAAAAAGPVTGNNSCSASGNVKVSVRLHMEFCDRLCMHQLAGDVRAIVEKKRQMMMTATSIGSSLLPQQQAHTTSRRPSAVTILPSPSSAPSSPLASAAAAAVSSSYHFQQPPLNGMIEGFLKALCRETLSGLVALHEIFNLIHRDMKLGNLLVDSHTGCCKITDFGTTMQQVGDGDTTETARGTLRYYAPELCGGRFSKKIDVWGLGASVFYFKLRTGYGDAREQWPPLGQKAAYQMGLARSRGELDRFFESGEYTVAQAEIDAACDQLFVDVGLRHLVKLMLRVKPAERATSTRALAWTFVLTSGGCAEVVMMAATTSSSSSLSSAATNESPFGGTAVAPPQHYYHQHGWPALHDSQRDIAAERLLQQRGIITANQVIVDVCDAIENRSQVPRLQKRAMTENKLGTDDVTTIDNALTKELVALAEWQQKKREQEQQQQQQQQQQHAAAAESTAAAVAASFQDHHESVFDSIQNNYAVGVVARRQLEQCRVVKEICAMVPMRT